MNNTVRTLRKKFLFEQSTYMDSNKNILIEKILQMLKFDLNISSIKKILNLKNDELVVLGVPRGMGKTSFVLSLLKNSSTNGCFISLCESPEEIASKEEKMNIHPYLKKYESICIDRPSLLELLELIVSQNDTCDYFVIDDMSGLNEDVNPLFSDDKNYQFVLRHLKLLAQALCTNIILVSQLDKRIDNVFDSRRYARKEKFIDHIMIIHHPAYYHIETNEFNEPFEDDDAFLYISKTNLKGNMLDIRLKFNYPWWTYPQKKVRDEIVPF